MDNATNCKHHYKLGVALQQCYSFGSPDFAGDVRGMTYSPVGKAQLVKCWKCVKCGHSKTK